ncbi:MAG: GNAT family N-acetyltransferase [Chitinophagaceae bacterium]
MDIIEEINWSLKPFERLTAKELYQVLLLRSKVFVVEQKCIYLDMDNKDQKAFHLMGWYNNLLVAYARLFAPGDYFREAAIGRIISAPEVRGQGIGKLLMQESIKIAHRMYGNVSIRIAAQYYLEEFYQSFGFKSEGEQFLEDGIPHVEMILRQ